MSKFKKTTFYNPSLNFTFFDEKMSVTKSNNISATRTVKMTTTPKNKDVKLLFKMGVPKLQRRSKSIKQIIKADRRYYARQTVYDGILDNVHIEGNSEIYEYMQNCNIQGKKVPLNVYQ